MEKPRIIQAKTPNFNNRPSFIEAPNVIVIHGTAGSDKGDANWIAQAKSKVSYHDLIQRDGTIVHFVNSNLRAWHAGKSIWLVTQNVNDFSIGIGLSNLGNGERYTRAQYNSLGYLLAGYRRDYGILLQNIVGHHHISGKHLNIRPDPKSDPWEWFDWTYAISVHYDWRNKT